MKSMVRGVFPPRAFSTEYAYKDITYALQLAEDTRIVARGAELTRGVLQQTIDAGHGKECWPVAGAHRRARVKMRGRATRAGFPPP